VLGVVDVRADGIQPHQDAGLIERRHLPGSEGKLIGDDYREEWAGFKDRPTYPLAHLADRQLRNAALLPDRPTCVAAYVRFVSGQTLRSTASRLVAVLWRSISGFSKPALCRERRSSASGVAAPAAVVHDGGGARGLEGARGVRGAGQRG
jgi:hypothetical protein